MTLFLPTPLFDIDLYVPTTIRKGVTSFTKHSFSNFVSYHRLNPNFKAFTTWLSLKSIPKKCTRGFKRLKRKEAILEMRALNKIKKWEVVELPKRKKKMG